MKRLIVIFIFCSAAMGLKSQHVDPKFSQHMFLVPVYNPGSVGANDRICLAGAFRNQWTGFPGSPIITTFTVHMPVNFLGRSHGIGINLVNDNGAFNNDFFFSAAYAFRLDIGMGKLGIGANFGLANQSLKPEWKYPEELMDDPSGDPAVPSGGGSVFGFDMGLGVFYNTENLYVGVSTTHLNETSFVYPEDNASVKLTRFYYLTAGYNIQLSNPMFEIMPSVLVRSDARLHEINLNTNLRYNKKFWGGVSYSVGGELTAMVGVELLNGILVGYSYDFGLSSIQKYNSGSHEITLRYCFDLSVDRSPQKYKSIRFL